MLDYLREPAAIYRQSFETIRREADLSALTADEAAIATRMMHACGMTDLVSDLVFNGDVAAAVRRAVAVGRPVFTDVEMVRMAVRASAQFEDLTVECLLNDNRVECLAREQSTTRSAAAVSLWQDRLADSVVIIGNAPTALFALLEMIDGGAAKPAAVFAFPVGFVGAAESKAELAADPRGIDCVTLLGRRGGSAMAAAAFNAVLLGVDER